MRFIVLGASALAVVALVLLWQDAPFDPTPENCARLEAERKKQPPPDPKAKASPERIACFRAKLDRLEKASKAALEESEAELAAAKAKMREMEKRAWRAPNGQFIWPDGQVWRYDDGTIVPPEIVARKVPPPR